MFSDNPAEIRLLFKQAHNKDVIVQLADGRHFMLGAIDNLILGLQYTDHNDEKI